MIITDQKKALMTIMSKRHPKDGSSMSAPMMPQMAKSEDGMMDGKHAAAQDMIAAFHEKDAGKLAEAWGNMHALHMADNTEPEVPEQPESES